MGAHFLINAALGELYPGSSPNWLREMVDELHVFDAWDADALRKMVSTFYRSRDSEYRYNFDLISKPPESDLRTLCVGATGQ